MPDMHTAIPCTGSTADQAVSTIHVQLDAAKRLTRPLTYLQILRYRRTYRGLVSKILPSQIAALVLCFKRQRK